MNNKTIAPFLTLLGIYILSGSLVGCRAEHRVVTTERRVVSEKNCSEVRDADGRLIRKDCTTVE